MSVVRICEWRKGLNGAVSCSELSQRKNINRKQTTPIQNPLKSTTVTLLQLNINSWHCCNAFLCILNKPKPILQKSQSRWFNVFGVFFPLFCNYFLIEECRSHDQRYSVVGSLISWSFNQTKFSQTHGGLTEAVSWSHIILKWFQKDIPQAFVWVSAAATDPAEDNWSSSHTHATDMHRTYK